jgi:flagellin
MAVRGVLVGAENLQAAESLIRDTDMAEQMVEFVKNSILVQSGTAMLAQANLKPQSVLQLLI